MFVWKVLVSMNYVCSLAMFFFVGEIPRRLRGERIILYKDVQTFP